MGLNSPRVGAVLGLDVDEFLRNARAARAEWNEFRKGVSEIRQSARDAGLALTGMSAAGVAGLGDAVGTFRDFEQALKNVQVVANASTGDLRRLTDAALEVGNTTRLTARQAADALYELASAGLDTQESLDALAGTTNLAIATQGDLRESALLITSTIKQYRLEFDEASRVADIFVNAIANSPATLDKLQAAMRYAGPVAKQFGLTLEDTVVAVEALLEAGLRGEQAGTTLRNALLRLSAPTARARDIIESLGLTVQDVSPRIVGLEQAIDRLAEAGLTAAEAAQLFGVRGINAYLVLSQKSRAELQKMRDELNQVGAANAIAVEQLNTFDGATRIFLSALETSRILVGGFIAQALRPLIEFFTTLVNAFNRAPRAVQGFATALAVISVATTGLTGLTLLMLSAVDRTILAYRAFTAALAANTGALGANAAAQAGNAAATTANAAATTGLAGAASRLGAGLSLVLGRWRLLIPLLRSPVFLAVTAAFAAITASAVALQRNFGGVGTAAGRVVEAMRGLITTATTATASLADLIPPQLLDNLERAREGLDTLFFEGARSASRAGVGVATQIDKLSSRIQLFRDLLVKDIPADDAYAAFRERLAQIEVQADETLQAIGTLEQGAGQSLDTVLLTTSEWGRELRAARESLSGTELLAVLDELKVKWADNLNAVRAFEEAIRLTEQSIITAREEFVQLFDEGTAAAADFTDKLTGLRFSILGDRDLAELDQVRERYRALIAEIELFAKTNDAFAGARDDLVADAIRQQEAAEEQILRAALARRQADIRASYDRYAGLVEDGETRIAQLRADELDSEVAQARAQRDSLLRDARDHYRDIEQAARAHQATILGQIATRDEAVAQIEDARRAETLQVEREFANTRLQIEADLERHRRRLREGDGDPVRSQELIEAAERRLLLLEEQRLAAIADTNAAFAQSTRQVIATFGDVEAELTASAERIAANRGQQQEEELAIVAATQREILAIYDRVYDAIADRREEFEREIVRETGSDLANAEAELEARKRATQQFYDDQLAALGDSVEGERRIREAAAAEAQAIEALNQERIARIREQGRQNLLDLQSRIARDEAKVGLISDEAALRAELDAELSRIEIFYRQIERLAANLNITVAEARALQRRQEVAAEEAFARRLLDIDRDRLAASQKFAKELGGLRFSLVGSQELSQLDQVRQRYRDLIAEIEAFAEVNEDFARARQALVADALTQQQESQRQIVEATLRRREQEVRQTYDRMTAVVREGEDRIASLQSDLARGDLQRELVAQEQARAEIERDYATRERAARDHHAELLRLTAERTRQERALEADRQIDIIHLENEIGAERIRLQRDLARIQQQIDTGEGDAPALHRQLVSIQERLLDLESQRAETIKQINVDYAASADLLAASYTGLNDQLDTASQTVAELFAQRFREEQALAEQQRQRIRDLYENVYDGVIENQRQLTSEIISELGSRAAIEEDSYQRRLEASTEFYDQQIEALAGDIAAQENLRAVANREVEREQFLHEQRLIAIRNDAAQRLADLLASIASNEADAKLIGDEEALKRELDAELTRIRAFYAQIERVAEDHGISVAQARALQRREELAAEAKYQLELAEETRKRLDKIIDLERRAQRLIAGVRGGTGGAREEAFIDFLEEGQSLNEAFDDIIEEFKRLGFETTRLEEARTTALLALNKGFVREMARLDFRDAVKTIDKNFDEMERIQLQSLQSLIEQWRTQYAEDEVILDAIDQLDDRVTGRLRTLGSGFAAALSGGFGDLSLDQLGRLRDQLDLTERQFGKLGDGLGVLTREQLEQLATIVDGYAYTYGTDGETVKAFKEAVRVIREQLRTLDEAFEASVDAAIERAGDLARSFREALRDVDQTEIGAIEVNFTGDLTEAQRQIQALRVLLLQADPSSELAKQLQGALAELTRGIGVLTKTAEAEARELARRTIEAYNDALDAALRDAESRAVDAIKRDLDKATEGLSSASLGVLGTVKNDLAALLADFTRRGFDDSALQTIRDYIKGVDDAIDQYGIRLAEFRQRELDLAQTLGSTLLKEADERLALIDVVRQQAEAQQQVADEVVRLASVGKATADERVRAEGDAVRAQLEFYRALIDAEDALRQKRQQSIDLLTSLPSAAFSQLDAAATRPARALDAQVEAARRAEAAMRDQRDALIAQVEAAQRAGKAFNEYGSDLEAALSLNRQLEERQQAQLDAFEQETELVLARIGFSTRLIENEQALAEAQVDRFEAQRDAAREQLALIASDDDALAQVRRSIRLAASQQSAALGQVRAASRQLVEQYRAEQRALQDLVREQERRGALDAAVATRRRLVQVSETLVGALDRERKRLETLEKTYRSNAAAIRATREEVNKLAKATSGGGRAEGDADSLQRQRKAAIDQLTTLKQQDATLDELAAKIREVAELNSQIVDEGGQGLVGGEKFDFDLAVQEYNKLSEAAEASAERQEKAAEVSAASVEETQRSAVEELTQATQSLADVMNKALDPEQDDPFADVFTTLLGEAAKVPDALTPIDEKIKELSASAETLRDALVEMFASIVNPPDDSTVESRAGLNVDTDEVNETFRQIAVKAHEAYLKALAEGEEERERALTEALGKLPDGVLDAASESGQKIGEHEARAIVEGLVEHFDTEALLDALQVENDVLGEFLNGQAVSMGATAGQGLMEAFADGVTSNRAPLLAAVDGVLQEVRDRLPSSDAKKGPLSTLTASGRALIKTFVAGAARERDFLATNMNRILSEVSFPEAASTAPHARGATPVMAGLAGVAGAPPVIMNIDGRSESAPGPTAMQARQLIRTLDGEMRRRGVVQGRR